MTLSIDPNGAATGHVQAATTSMTITISTTNSNDLIVVDVLDSTNFTMTVSGSTLGAFTLHANDSGFGVFRWSKVAASPLTSEVITIAGLGGVSSVANAYAVSSANTSSPWDAGGPVSTGGADPYSITTVNTNTMVIAVYNNGSANPTAGSGFTLISGADFVISEYKVLSSAQTIPATLTTGAGTASEGIVDAIVASGAAPPPSSFPSGLPRLIMLKMEDQ